MNNYSTYTDSELDTLLYEPWEVSDQPYMLHAAYALNALVELCCSNDSDSDENDDEDESEKIWGMMIPQKVISRMVVDIAEDFNDAAKNHKPIKIAGKSYSIRKVNAYDHKRLTQIFRFPTIGEDCVIAKSGILNLGNDLDFSSSQYELTKEELVRNRTYLRQIIRLAEDDRNNGWDKLTDMEIVLYCWALFYHKTQSECLPQFLNEYKDYVYVKESDIPKCYVAKAALRDKPVGLYTFSKDKVMAWNEKHQQKSIAATISQEEAEDYWYNNALEGNFKPEQ